MTPPQVIVVMGVAGCGKTTIGEQLAQEIGWGFHDADEFHPPENIAKMREGIPLTDDDRVPWLAALHHRIKNCLDGSEKAVVTCSALKESYRHVLTVDPERVKFVYLRGSRNLLWARINHRQDHFMKPAMLDSQLATLEEPVHALILNIAPQPELLVAAIRRAFSL